MKSILIVWLLSAMLAGCQTGLDTNNPARAKESSATGPVIEDSGIQFSLAGMKNCSYPVNDPLFEKKHNRKLVLLQVQVRCIRADRKESAIPGEPTLTDNRGNEYESFPSVIAMAQTSGCIGNDDIRDYNAIWNGNMNTGENYTAWVLGFELPENAVPEKLYWNRRWRNKELFFDFNAMKYTVNH